jgi:hypothetical protein
VFLSLEADDSDGPTVSLCLPNDTGMPWEAAGAPFKQ